MRQRYTIVIEQASHNYSAYVPDVPGCVATGRSIDETTRHMAEALALHFAGLAEDGEAIPASATRPAEAITLAADDRVAVVEEDVPGIVAATA
jgi:predicted RNase H-like HicB family nuclease